MEQLILPDGSAIGSGAVGQTAICQIRWTRHRNDGDELALGSACDSCLEAELFSPERPQVPVGTRLIYQEDGKTRGIFYCQDLQRKSRSRWLLTACDALTRFDRELTDFWPGRGDDTVLSLLLGLCAHCNVRTAITQLPGGDLPAPVMEGFSGRQVLQFIGQAAGRWFCIDEGENLCAGWYGGRETIENYSRLSCAEYTTEPISRVLLRKSKNDPGTGYPEGETGGCTLIIQGNPIFEGDPRDTAQRLQEQLSGFSHTPFRCTLLPGQEVTPGALVEFTDLDGVPRIGAVMGWEKENGVLTVRGTGSYSLQSPQALSHMSIGSVENQLLTLSRTAQGILVSHTDLMGNVGTLQLGLSGVQSRVTAVEDSAASLATQTSLLTQNAGELSLAVTRLAGELEDKPGLAEFTQVTEHFLFDAEGMTIQNSASGMGILVSENQVAFTGGEDPATVIRPDNMETARLTVRNRLDLGNFSFLPRTDGSLSFRFTGSN